jgi:hypothetical protein
MKFAKIVFNIAGIWGLLILTPQYFFEKLIGRDHPPVITHPEYFYGFVGVGLAWQIAFLIIARDPIRFRPLMIACIIEKFSFLIACIVLHLLGRTNAAVLGFSFVDGILGILFVLAYLRTPVSQPLRRK